MKFLKLLILILFIIGIVLLVYRLIGQRNVPPLSFRPAANVNDNKVTFAPGEVKVTNGIKHTVPLDFLVSGGQTRSNIVAIDQPKFVIVKEADKYLRDDGLGLAISYQGQNRFYPFQILVWHEVVNDQISDLPLAVTFSPLSGSAISYVRRLGAQEIALGVTDNLYNNSSVLHEKMNGNLLSQLTGEVIEGELAGQKLSIWPSDVITWKSFKENYPGGQVLSNETGFKKDYSFDPYGGYYTGSAIYYPLTQLDQRFHPKASLLGIVINREPKAYIDNKIREKGLINDELAGTPLVIWVDQATKAIRIYERRIGGKVLSFEIKEGRLFDHQTNSTWNFTGEAVEGKLKGSKLFRPEYVSSYWFVWYAFYPTTIVWGL